MSEINIHLFINNMIKVYNELIANDITMPVFLTVSTGIYLYSLKLLQHIRLLTFLQAHCTVYDQLSQHFDTVYKSDFPWINRCP